jgi:hypothetical protein
VVWRLVGLLEAFLVLLFSTYVCECAVDNPLTTAPTVEVLTTPVNLCWKLEGPSTATLKKYPKLAVPNNKQPGETKINWGVMSISAIHQPLHYRVPYLSGTSMVVPI